jgi:SAM-dependent methyltransferase
MRKKLFAVPVLLLSGILALFVAAAPAAGFVQDEVSLDVPYVPTTPELVEQMLKLGQIKSTDTVYDLGCGDGRIVIMAAEKFGARGVGVDLNPERIREATENAKKAGVASRVRFVNGNLFDVDIHNATVVTLYLLPDVNLKLRPKLLKDLKPGTRIVSHSFDMGDWKPDKEIEVNGSRLFLWTVPNAK